MKTLKKISLASMAKEEMKEREMSHLLGGLVCCICSCSRGSSANSSITAQSSGDMSSGGYGVEKSS